MFHKKYRVSNEELQMAFYYRTKQKALRIQMHLNENMTPISFEDTWLVHNLDTGELIR